MIKIKVTLESTTGIILPKDSIVIPKMVHLISDFKKVDDAIVVTRKLAYDIQLFADLNDVGEKPNITIPLVAFPYGVTLNLTEEQWNTLKTNIEYGEELLLDAIENGYQNYTGIGEGNGQIISA